MDTDESQSNSNSPPYVHVSDGRIVSDRIIHHVLPFSAINGNPSCIEINGNMNGKAGSSHNNNNGNSNNNNDEEVGNLVNSDLSKNYASHHSQNSHSNNLSKGPGSPLYSGGDHITNSRYPPVHKLTHQTRSPNAGHQVSSPCTSGSTNTPPPPPPCLFMIQSAGSTELLNHPHGSPLTAGVAVLATMPSPVTAGVPPNATGVNLPSIHQYTLAANKRKPSFNFAMPIDATVLTNANHSQSSPPAAQHHHHHHHQGLSIHNSQQQPSPPTSNIPMVTEMAQIHTAASIVTPSVIRGSVTQGPPSVQGATVALPHSLATASTGPIGKNRDEKRRATHNEVERRRRDKINSWILKLSKLVPDCNSDQTKQGQSKGGILAKTCDYICLMENQLRSYQRENQDLKSEIMVLREKLSELESERHKLLSALTSTSLRESSPSSIESSSSPTAVSAVAVSTSNQVSAAINSIFQPSASVNQVKQERAAFHSVPNTFPPSSSSSSSSSSNNHHQQQQHHHHIHSQVHNASSSSPSSSPILSGNDQMSVIVTVTSAPNVQQVHNLIPHEQLVQTVARESSNSINPNRASSSSSCSSSSSPPLNSSSSASNGTSNDKLLHGIHPHPHHHHHNVHHHHHHQNQHQHRSTLTGENSNSNDGASGQNVVINSHVETHESNHEGLVNLKISSVLKSDPATAHESSSTSSSSPVSINNDSSASTPTSHVIHHSSPLDETVNTR